MRVRWLGITLLLAVLVTAAVPVSTQAQSSGYTVPVTGDVQSFAGSAGTFNGSLTLTQFKRRGSNLTVDGVLDGTIVSPDKSPIGNVRSEPVSISVLDVQGTSEDLRMTLGPVAETESQLTIYLEPIVIKSGIQPDNKQLANLLRAANRLVDGNSPPSGLASLLNQILRVLSK